MIPGWSTDGQNLKQGRVDARIYGVGAAWSPDPLPDEVDNPKKPVIWLTEPGEDEAVGRFARDGGNRGVWDLRAPQREDLERAGRDGLTVSWTFTPEAAGDTGSAPLQSPAST
jgi:hypothetical protein